MKKNYLLPLLAILLLCCGLLTACQSSSDDSPAARPDTDVTDMGDPSVAPPASDTTIPAIHIRTQGGADIPDTKEKVNCRVDLVSADKDQCAQNLIATVRTRGNGTMYIGKKTGKFPYKLKFDEKINPFDTGDGKEKDWVLLANVGEATMLRDYAAKFMADLMGRFPYCPNAKPVNLYINGEYVGVYCLTEQVEAKDSRVPINDALKGDTNGFLVELDAYAGRTETENSFQVRDNFFAVQSNVFSDTQLQYIKSYITEVDNAIYAGDRDALDALVDMDSLVDMYLLQEYAKNTDVGFSSFYMYRDVQGKLFFAPPWDFDLSFGNDKRLDNGSEQGLYVAEGREELVQSSLWYMQLMKHEWFYTLVTERWQTVSAEIVPQVIEEVRAQASILAPMMEYNYKRWHFLGKFIHQEPDAIVALTTYKEHVDYLIRWMENRRLWLDSEFQKPFSS
ncbi:MAG: hypothetical protein E7599_04500 [Ruminococcaceae bacterium]|nr:hypothetical protein [Oscillospiraceae bacterium]